MGPAIRRIQIFGERCSGTNFLRELLDRNLPSAPVVRDFGWKHGFHPPEVAGAPDCLFLVIHRNPFDWLRSLHRRPFHAARELRRIPFSDFLRREWSCIWDEDASRKPRDPDYGAEMISERNPETGARFDNVIRMRTAKIHDWQAMGRKAPHTEYVRYEDLAARPDEFIESLASRYGLEPARAFSSVEGARGGDRKFRPRSYPPIISRDIDFILENLDEALELAIGYDIRLLADKARSEGTRLFGAIRNPLPRAKSR